VAPAVFLIAAEAAEVAMAVAAALVLVMVGLRSFSKL
jgi:hypothetical protein